MGQIESEVFTADEVRVLLACVSAVLMESASASPVQHPKKQELVTLLQSCRSKLTNMARRNIIQP